MSPKSEGFTVSLTLTKALRLLRVLCNSAMPLSGVELSQELGLNISTATRLLTTLEREGYVTKLPSSRYRPSANLVLMTSSWSHLNPAHLVTREILTQLRDATGETAFMVTRAGYLRVVIESVQSDQPVRGVVSAGDAFPLLDGATGYALLADAKPREIAHIREKTIELFGQGHLVSEQAEKSMLKSLKSSGWTTLLRERPLSGTLNLGVPIRGVDGSVVHALGLLGPADRWPAKRIREAAALALTAQRQVSAELARAGLLSVGQPTNSPVSPA